MLYALFNKSLLATKGGLMIFKLSITASFITLFFSRGVMKFDFREFLNNLDPFYTIPSNIIFPVSCYVGTRFTNRLTQKKDPLSLLCIIAIQEQSEIMAQNYILYKEVAEIDKQLGSFACKIYGLWLELVIAIVLTSSFPFQPSILWVCFTSMKLFACLNMLLALQTKAPKTAWRGLFAFHVCSFALLRFAIYSLVFPFDSPLFISVVTSDFIIFYRVCFNPIGMIPNFTYYVLHFGTQIINVGNALYLNRIIQKRSHFYSYIQGL